MLIECVLAVISLIAVGTLSVDGSMAAVQSSLGLDAISPTVIFGTGIANFFAVIGLPEAAVNATKTIIMLAVSCFCLTSLDTATRLGRFLFQELFASNKKGEKNILSNMYVATVITAAFGFILCLAGYEKVWPLFGAANQLVAVPAFLAVAAYLKKTNKNNKMLYFPIVFMSVATLTSMVFTFKNNLVSIIEKTAEGTALFTCVLQDIIIIPLVILAVILIVDGTKVLVAKKEA
jgi:carbon starvation protein